ncbi:MAG: hypothetical protein HY322_18550 [Betaproteobacteria bacterium]|nr:hypothetical protein [Betaproteobacteria bacterium]
MADPIVPVDVEAALDHAADVTHYINAAIFQCRNSPYWTQSHGHDDGLLTLLQVTGYMADKLTSSLGGTGMCVTLEAWLKPDPLPGDAIGGEQPSATH